MFLQIKWNKQYWTVGFSQASSTAPSSFKMPPTLPTADLGKSHEGIDFRVPHILPSIYSPPVAPLSGREITNAKALIISLPHVIPPTFVGYIGNVFGIQYSWYLIKAKINDP